MPEPVTTNPNPTEGAATSGPDASVDALLSSFEKEQAEPKVVTPPVGDGLTPEVMKALETLDPEKLPQNLKERIEKPFKSSYTPKFQQLAEERRQFAEQQAKWTDVLTAKLAEQGKSPTTDEKERLRAEIASGNMEAIGPLIDSILEDRFNSRVAPVARDIAMNNAIQEAQRLTPMVAQYEQEIGSVLQADPVLRQMAVAENYKFTPYVLRGIALDIHNAHLAAENAELKKGREEYAKQVLAAWIKKAKGIPSTTSRAGSTTQATTGGEQPLTLRESMEASFEESGLAAALSGG